MTDKWFIQDIEKQMQHRNRVVILDPKEECAFLLPLLENKKYHIIKTDKLLTEHWQTVKEELFFRHEAETKYKDKSVIFYVTRPQHKLSFLFDYCFTHGCLDLSNPTEWLKNKLYTNTGLQVNMENPMLLVAGKLGIGKDIAWWKKILQNLEDLISIEDELLPFLQDPESYFRAKDKEIIRLFEEKCFEIIGQPYSKKPPKTLANEVVSMIFDSLLNNDISNTLLSVYYKWVDSSIYSESLKSYISNFKIDDSINVWAVHPDHCFDEIDKLALQQISSNIRNKSYIAEKISKIKVRTSGHKVKRLTPIWWLNVITLLEFDTSPLSACTNFDKVVDFYTSRFFELDRAIRVLYGNFLHDQAIIRPLQEHYDSLNYELLQQWFEYADTYKPNQKGYLVDLLKEAKPGIAVIVGDGLRYEIAAYVAASLEKQFNVERNIMFADMPSETEHNMTALYVGSDELIAVQKEREKKLTILSGKEIDFINLEALNYGYKGDYLVLTYKDIDSAGEKLQHGAIKLFDEFEKVLTEKITLLLKMGFNEVHLITDHGFVLTGLLDEADKIEPNATGSKKVIERFIRTVEKQSNPEWIGFDRPKDEFNYVYVAKNNRPFKSKGMYGFSHGGFTPQEIILPNFIFSNIKEATKGLVIKIANKKELSDVTGSIFAVKLQAVKSRNDLFSSSRKMQILLFANGKQYSASNIFTMDAGNSRIVEFSFKDNNEVTASLIDAETQEQLDSVRVVKSNMRDFGGLL